MVQFGSKQQIFSPSAITSLDTDVILDASACRLLLLSTADQLGGAIPWFFETCLKFLTFFRRLEAFPRFSCSPCCKYLLEIWQYSRTTFLNFSYMKKRVKCLNWGKKTNQSCRLEKLCLTAQREMERV